MGSKKLEREEAAFYRELLMVTTIQGVIENGQVRLPEGTVLPEQQTVYVVVPDYRTNEPPKVPGVRLANPADAAKFEMTVLWEDGR